MICLDVVYAAYSVLTTKFRSRSLLRLLIIFSGMGFINI